MLRTVLNTTNNIPDDVSSTCFSASASSQVGDSQAKVHEHAAHALVRVARGVALVSTKAASQMQRQWQHLICMA